MKVLTLLGTRPEIIRLSRVIPKLDRVLNTEHIVVHTEQNDDPNLNENIFKDLGLREPNEYLNIGSEVRFGIKVGCILDGVDTMLKRYKPDKFLVLGDTFSSLGAIAAKRRGVTVYHMEAGNRCWNWESPEEINRHIIDHISDIHLPYSRRSKDNLVAEGIHLKNIYVIGNPIVEVLNYYDEPAFKAWTNNSFKVSQGQYFLVTLHRAENVDNVGKLRKVFDVLYKIGQDYKKKVIFSVHPRTKQRMKDFGNAPDKSIICTDPLPFTMFVALERHAFCALTDSGTVQEECSIFQTPCVILRDATERPETQEQGSGVVCDIEEEAIYDAVKAAILPGDTLPPDDYTKWYVSNTVARLMVSLAP